MNRRESDAGEPWSAFTRCATAWGVPLDNFQIGQFQRYLEELCSWNQRFNLTRITAPQEIVVKHFLDSLSCARVADFGEAKNLIDVGTGAGFPGLALKIAFPHLRLTLLDSTAKRLRFCHHVASALSLQYVESVHARAEAAAHISSYREAFDIVTARAVSRLIRLAEWLLPFARCDGVCIAMKGPDVAAEAAEAEPAIARYGGGALRIRSLELPIAPVGRSLVVIPKVRPTPAKLPPGPNRRY